MVGGETAVVGWMPVLSGDHEIESRLKAIDDRDDLVTFAHRERSAGAEVVLHVDDDKGVHGRRFSVVITLRVMTFLTTEREEYTLTVRIKILASPGGGISFRRSDRAWRRGEPRLA